MWLPYEKLLLKSYLITPLFIGFLHLHAIFCDGPSTSDDFTTVVGLTPNQLFSSRHKPKRRLFVGKDGEGLILIESLHLNGGEFGAVFWRENVLGMAL